MNNYVVTGEYTYVPYAQVARIGAHCG